jgi:hypothetical protein
MPVISVGNPSWRALKPSNVPVMPLPNSNRPKLESKDEIDLMASHIGRTLQRQVGLRPDYL